MYRRAYLNSRDLSFWSRMAVSNELNILDRINCLRICQRRIVGRRGRARPVPPSIADPPISDDFRWV
jgi:hypothetical protein